MDRSLEEFQPYLISANVRDRFSGTGLRVADGIGEVGDLIIGEILPSIDQTLTVIDQALGSHQISSPTRVLSILGTRLSTTHVNAGIPSEGLEVSDGSAARWIAGESGLVGRLFFEADSTTPMGAETSVGFRCIGLLKNQKGDAVNIESLAVSPKTADLHTPILLIGATAAEAGKTTLACEIIRSLSGRGRKIAAVKVTGTGGTMDSQKHREAGAFLAVDQVDAGLITTYCPEEVFRERILRSFLFAQDHNPDLILAELGGDLTFANNPTLLRMPEIRRNWLGLIVVSGDPLSCYGVARYLTEELGVPSESVRHFSSPFRNPAGMKARADVMGVEDISDPKSRSEIEAVLRSLLGNRALEPGPL